jgi:hypothetical protein
MSHVKYLTKAVLVFSLVNFLIKKIFVKTHLDYFKLIGHVVPDFFSNDETSSLVANLWKLIMEHCYFKQKKTQF